MADTDSDLDAGANQNQGDSEGSNVNTESESVQKLLSRIDVLEQQQKALQGDKDRGVNTVRKDQKELKGQFAEIKELIEEHPEDAEWRFRLNRLLELQESEVVPDDVSQNTGEANLGSKADEVDPKLLEKYGVNPQSSEYLAQVKAGLSGFEAVLATAVGAKPPENPGTGALGLSGGAGGSGESVSIAQQVLKEQFTKALDEAQKATGHLTPNKLLAIEAEYIKKGLILEG